jgi:hypothetical protein
MEVPWRGLDRICRADRRENSIAAGDFVTGRRPPLHLYAWISIA